MCTLSIIPLPDSGYRVVCNRDESRGRPAAAPPRWRTLDGSAFRALWPTDTQAGGTWIGAGAHGLTLALLNLNLDEPPDLPRIPGLLSRGLVIPALISQPDAPAAARALAHLSLSRFAPFRLVAVDIDPLGTLPRVIEAAWDRSTLRFKEHVPVPACFASSGLGDHLVQCRLGLFHDLVVSAGATTQSQDRFHAHRWEDRPELSVLMSRADARTVSVSTVEARLGRPGADVRMGYTPVHEPEPVPAGA